MPSSSQPPSLLWLLLIPSTQDCWADRSPLHEAAAQGRLLTLKTLIAQGINVNLVTINRVSSLHEACLGGHAACAKALLENGAQVNGATVHGATPLFNACCSGSAECVNVLLEFGAKAQPETHLASPIHEAVKRGHRQCMEILLANNVNIDQELIQFGTPLYVACSYQRVDCVKKLLELGASVDHGQCLDTPLHVAVRQSNMEIVRLLTDYGANLKCRNAQGKTALDLAAPKSSVEQALLLCKDQEIGGSAFLIAPLPFPQWVLRATVDARGGKKAHLLFPSCVGCVSGSAWVEHAIKPSPSYVFQNHSKDSSYINSPNCPQEDSCK